MAGKTREQGFTLEGFSRVQIPEEARSEVEIGRTAIYGIAAGFAFERLLDANERRYPINEEVTDQIKLLAAKVVTGSEWLQYGARLTLNVMQNSGPSDIATADEILKYLNKVAQVLSSQPNPPTNNIEFV